VADPCVGDVPLAWWRAEYVADTIFHDSLILQSRTSFEFRAAHDVLTLTSFLLDTDKTRGRGLPSPGLGGRLLTNNQCWLRWCRLRLDATDPSRQQEIVPADALSAWRAWQRLHRVQLHWTDAREPRANLLGNVSARPLLPGWRIGLPIVRSVIVGKTLMSQSRDSQPNWTARYGRPTAFGEEVSDDDGRD
jgi:hypothetical protein